MLFAWGSLGHGNWMRSACATGSQCSSTFCVDGVCCDAACGGGVDGAIHRAAGRELLAECRGLGGCPTGSARITRGYALPARHVIHTVGPVWSGGDAGEARLLASCYRACFALAREHGLRSLAFPAVSCGVYGYPLDEAAAIALRTVYAYLQDHPSIDRVRFVLFTNDALVAFDRALEGLRG